MKKRTITPGQRVTVLLGMDWGLRERAKEAAHAQGLCAQEWYRRAIYTALGGGPLLLLPTPGEFPPVATLLRNALVELPIPPVLPPRPVELPPALEVLEEVVPLLYLEPPPPAPVFPQELRPPPANTPVKSPEEEGEEPEWARLD